MSTSSGTLVHVHPYCRWSLTALIVEQSTYPVHELNQGLPGCFSGGCWHFTAFDSIFLLVVGVRHTRCWCKEAQLHWSWQFCFPAAPVVYLERNSQVSVGELEPGSWEQMVSFQRAIFVHELDSASPSSHRPGAVSGAGLSLPFQELSCSRQNIFL